MPKLLARNFPVVIWEVADRTEMSTYTSTFSFCFIFLANHKSPTVSLSVSFFFCLNHF